MTRGFYKKHVKNTSLLTVMRFLYAREILYLLTTLLANLNRVTFQQKVTTTLKEML